MPRGRSAFRQSDLSRALKAVRDAKMKADRIEWVDGKPVIILSKASETNEAKSISIDVNPFEMEAERLRKGAN
jgi:hypothetical protein